MKKRFKKHRRSGKKKVKSSIVVREVKWDRKSRRPDDKAIDLMEELSLGFKEWYARNYDESGRYIGKRILGLKG